MKRLLFIICALLFVSAGAFAQVGAYSSTALDSYGKRISSPIVKVCAVTDSACSTPVTIYKDSSSTALSNPFTGDSQGNYSFWAVPGNYYVQVAKAGYSPVTTAISIGGAGDAKQAGANAFTAANTFTLSDAVPITSTNNAHVVGQVNRGTFFRCGVITSGSKCYGSFAQSIDFTGGITQYTHFVGGDHNITISTPFASAFNSDAYGVVAGLTAPADGGSGWPGAAFRAEQQNSGVGMWAVAYDTTDGATPIFAWIRAQCATGTCLSQIEKIYSMASGVATTPIQRYADNGPDYHYNLPTSARSFFLDQQSTATSGGNFSSPFLNLAASGWDGSAAAVMSWKCNHNLNGSGTVTVSQFNCTTNNVPVGAVKQVVFPTTAVMQIAHYKGNATPSIAAGTGAGTSPTVTLVSNSNDAFGRISVLTGTTPAASATVATVTFAFSYGNQVFCVVTPSNAAAAALTGTGKVFANGFFTGSFTVASGSTALAATTQYLYDYHCGS